MSLVLVSGQFLGTYDNSYRFGYDSLSDDFGGSSGGSFGGFGSGLASIRDPRQNRGKHTNYEINAKKCIAIQIVSHPIKIDLLSVDLFLLFYFFFCSLFALHRLDSFMQNKRK